MRRIIIGEVAVILAVATAAATGAMAAAPTGYKVTGGGQYAAPQNGPGQTVGFVARNVNGASGTDQSDASNDAATGQFQYNDHHGAKLHGTVTCLVVDPSAHTARIAGTYTDASGNSTPFKAVLTDSDQGAPQNTGTDTIVVRPNASNTDCTDNSDDTTQQDLDRGNVQIHKANS